MTTAQLSKREEKAQGLRVFQVDDIQFYVESDEAKVAYKVTLGEITSCTCGDFVKNIKTDPGFICKHVIAAREYNGNTEQVSSLVKRKPTLNSKFIKNLQGKDFVLYAGLLDLAHQKGLLKIDVDIIQYPTKDNGYEAVCRAIAQTNLGDTFTDIGDASPKNTNKMISNHILRMASTRAKARALRDMTNIGMTAFEELSDISEALGDENTSSGKPVRNTVKTKTAEEVPSAPAEEGEKKEPVTSHAQDNSGERRVLKISEAQKRAMYNLAKRRGISDDELNKMSTEKFGVTVDALTPKDASSFIRVLQATG